MSSSAKRTREESERSFRCDGSGGGGGGGGGDNHQNHARAERIANARRKKYALYSQVGDSYFFTSTQRAEDLDITKVNLDTDVHLLEVIPCPSSAENAAPLGSLFPRIPHTPPPIKPKFPNSETVPVQFLNYGPYLTFAPTTDTTAATLTLEETVRARQYRMQQLAAAACAGAENEMDGEDGDDDEADTGIEFTPEESNADGLAEEDVDAEVLTDVARSGEDDGEERRQMNAVVDDVLKQNSELLAALARYQNRRLASDTPDEVSNEEVTLASLISGGLAALANLAEPLQLMTAEAAERTMLRLWRFDAAYRGTLPEGWLNAFSAGAASSLPAASDATEPATPAAPAKAHHGRQSKDKAKAPAAMPASKAAQVEAVPAGFSIKEDSPRFPNLPYSQDIPPHLDSAHH